MDSAKQNNQNRMQTLNKTLDKKLAKASLEQLAKKRIHDTEYSSWSETILNKGPEFEDPCHDLRDTTLPAKLISYYLPQFYPFKENNEWWGDGFTEWRNSTSARARFDGHHQPHLPLDLGYYDLRLIETMHRQAEMAKKAGVHAWCFYHYRFGDKRLMDVPVNNFLDDPSLDMPFCLMWANENWARTWDGKKNDILIRQNYDPRHDDAMIDDLARHFSDPRYLKVDGKPLYYIYCPSLIPDAKRRIDDWRNLLVKRHNIEATFHMALTYDDTDPRPYGLDGAIEFPPHNSFKKLPSVNDSLQNLDPNFGGEMRRYDDLIKDNLLKEKTEFDLVKCVLPAWDNEPRRTNRGYGFVDCSPSKYEIWLSEAIQYAKDNPIHGESLVAVNAWNEWAEGAHLEPDVHYGSAYLNATARALLSHI
jgi:hypothetical protein